MMEKFKNKYRIASTRLQNWNYRWAAAYFITIITKNREHYFGEIANQRMSLSHIGVIADLLWHKIPTHAQNVELGAFVVMPDHIHGIIIIKRFDRESEKATAMQQPESEDEKTMNKTEPQSIGQRRFQNIGKNSLSSIVGSYKSSVSRHARRLGFEFNWQPLFHERIIRDDQAYQNITNYIHNNPANWPGKKGPRPFSVRAGP